MRVYMNEGWLALGRADDRDPGILYQALGRGGEMIMARIQDAKPQGTQRFSTTTEIAPSTLTASAMFLSSSGRPSTP